MITILFLSSNSWISQAIKWFTGSNVSHCGIGMRLDGVPVVLHATVGGVQISTLDYILKNYKNEGEFEICSGDIEKNVASVIKEIGTPYDYMGMLGYIFVMVGRWLHEKWKNPWASPNAVVCSELVLSLNIEEDIPDWNGLDPSSITPSDLLAICNKNSFGTFRKV